MIDLLQGERGVHVALRSPSVHQGRRFRRLRDGPHCSLRQHKGQMDGWIDRLLARLIDVGINIIFINVNDSLQI